MLKKKLTITTLTGFAVIILTSVFYGNVLNTVNPQLFSSFQKDSESLVVGRLYKSRLNGVFSGGGFLGFNYPHDSVIIPGSLIEYQSQNLGWWGYESPNEMSKFSFQYDAFENDYIVDKYETYFSQQGMQGLIYHSLGFLFNITGDDLIKLCQFLNSLFLALVLCMLLIWIFHYFGWLSTIACFIFILCSQWLIVFADNMLYVAGFYFLPMVINLWYLHFSIGKINRVKTLFLITFFFVTLKCIVSGFDFIIPVLVMSVLPLLFYAYVEQWKFKKTIFNALSLSAFALSGVLFSLILLGVQIGLYIDSLSEGFDYLAHTTERRTYGNVRDLEYIIKQNNAISLFDILDYYLNGFAIDFTHVINFRIKIKILFSQLLLFITLVPLINLYKDKKLMGLAIMILSSLFGPLGWFVIFKYHTVTHTHMNLFVWYLPTLIFSVIFIMYTMEKGFQYVILNTKINTDRKT